METRTIILTPFDTNLSGKYRAGEIILVKCDAINEAFTISVPDAKNIRDTLFYFKKTDSSSNVITLSLSEGQLIDGAQTFALSAQYTSVGLLSDGSNFLKISTVGIGGGGVSDHGSLTGLGDDDHTQYLLANGSRGLSGNWNAGSYRITSNSIDTNTYYYMGGNKAINIDGTDSISIGTGILGGAAYSTHIGANSGRISIGLYNVGISANSLYNVYNGAYNVAIAGASLYSLVSGVYNIAIGTTSQYFNVSGGYNTSIGTNALRNVLSSYNTGICLNALQNLQYGTNNTGIGINVFYSLGIGYYNVGIGDAAGYYLSTTSDRNTLIGYAAGLGTTSYVASGMVKIGYYAGANDNNSNRLYIHNANSGNTGALIYGEFNTTVASQLLRINGVLELPIIKTGATQASAGATVNEIWKTSGHATLPDNVVLCGV